MDPNFVFNNLTFINEIRAIKIQEFVNFVTEYLTGEKWKSKFKNFHQNSILVHIITMLQNVTKSTFQCQNNYFLYKMNNETYESF